MSGTIFVSKDNFFDVRTVDFLVIVETIRPLTDTSSTAEKLLEMVDICAMNMICADELNPIEFLSFAYIMQEVYVHLANQSSGLNLFFESIFACIDADERLVLSRDMSY